MVFSENGNPDTHNTLTLDCMAVVDMMAERIDLPKSTVIGRTEEYTVHDREMTAIGRRNKDKPLSRWSREDLNKFNKHESSALEIEQWLERNINEVNK